MPNIPVPQPIKAVIIEDEPPARMKLAAFIARIPELELVATFSDGKSALQYLQEPEERLVFLDIQMESFTGIQLLDALRIRPRIIITSAYEEYALKSFEYEVSDYLLKPYSFERFQKAVDKGIRDIHLDRVQRESEQAYILIKTEYKMEKVPLSSILFIEGMKDYLRIHTATHRIMTLKSMTSMQAELPSDQFARIHKSYIVSLHRITSLEKEGVWIGGQRIPIGKSYKERFMERVNEVQG